MKSGCRLGWPLALFAAGLAGSVGAEEDASRALRQLAQHYYAAQAAHDLPAAVALWDPQSPELPARRRALRLSFAAHERVELGSLAVDVAIEAETGRIEASFETSLGEAGSPAAPRSQTHRRILTCVRRDGQWQLSRDGSFEEELALELLAAGSDIERRALLAGRAHSPGALVQALVGLAQGRQAAGRPDDALAALQLAEGLAGQAPADLQRVLDGLGTFHRLKGDDAAALEHYGRSLDLARQAGDVLAEAATLEGAGQSHQRLGAYEQARELFERSLALRRSAGRDHESAGVFLGLGRLSQQQGDFDEATAHYQQALTRASAVEDNAQLASILNGLGGIEHERGNYGRALEHYGQALALAESQHDRALMARALNNMGLAQRLQGRLDLAADLLARALALREQLGDRSGQATTLLNVGMVARLQGDLERALDCYRRSLALEEAAGNRAGVALTLNSIGVLHESQGRAALALEHFERSLAISERLGNKARVVQTLANVAKAHQALGDHEAALSAARRTAGLARELGHAESVLSALTTAGEELELLGRRDQARQAFEEAVQVLEEMRSEAGATPEEQQRFLESRVSPYGALARLRIADGDVPAGLAHAERAKARVLLDVLLLGRADVTKALSAEERAHEQELQRRFAAASSALQRERRRGGAASERLAALEAERQQARLESEAYRTRLFAAHPELRTRRGEVRAFDWNDADLVLPDAGTVAVEFLVGREATFLFVLARPRRGEPGVAGPGAVRLTVHRLPIEARRLEGLVTAFRAGLAARDLSVGGQAESLFRELLGPARAELVGREALVIVPDGPLWELPFQALKPARGRYLIEDLAVAYAPSLTVLREMQRLGQRATSSEPPRLLAFGNPAPAGTRGKAATTLGEALGPLPDAERQVERLRQLYGPERSTVYVGAEAREERLTQGNRGRHVLHLATHGVLDDRQPMYSYLLMAPGSGSSGDGLLEAREIMDLDLGADLVVLAACETGRGRVGAGEGLIGLVWAVFVAGSPTSVVSLWRVDAASTTELMVEFHRQLLLARPSSSGARGTGQALRKAALRLLRTREYRHPFYWAGFVAVGDAR